MTQLSWFHSDKAQQVTNYKVNSIDKLKDSQKYSYKIIDTLMLVFRYVATSIHMLFILVATYSCKFLD